MLPSSIQQPPVRQLPSPEPPAKGNASHHVDDCQEPACTQTTASACASLHQWLPHGPCFPAGIWGGAELCALVQPQGCCSIDMFRVQCARRWARCSSHQGSTADATLPCPQSQAVSFAHLSGAHSCRQEAQRQFRICCRSALESGQPSPVRRPSPLPMMQSAMRDPKKFQTMQAAMPR